MRAELPIEDIDREWPREIRGDPFWDAFLDDLESAVQHVPSGILKAAPDLEQWRQDWDFLWLYLDYALMMTGHTSDQLIALREKIAKQRPRTVSEVDRLVRDCASATE